MIGAGLMARAGNSILVSPVSDKDPTGLLVTSQRLSAYALLDDRDYRFIHHNVHNMKHATGSKSSAQF